MPASTVNASLHTYMNDHLSGATMALQLIDHLLATVTHEDERSFLTRLRQEVTDDRHTLETVLTQSGGQTSSVRQAGGVLMERLGRLKLAIDDPSQQSLARLEALEMLTLGIHGKGALWRALAVAARPELQGTDFGALERRASEQHQQIEAHRLETARRVLGRNSR